MSKPVRSKSLHGDGVNALTPQSSDTSPFPKGYRIQSAQIAALEVRLNGQQKRIADQEKFIRQLKKETRLLRALFHETPSALGAILTPSELGRPARKGKL